MSLLNAGLAAERLDLAKGTLAKWRVTGEGPQFIKVGRAVRYDPTDLDRWLDARKQGSTSQNTSRAA